MFDYLFGDELDEYEVKLEAKDRKKMSGIRCKYACVGGLLAIVPVTLLWIGYNLGLLSGWIRHLSKKFK